MAAPITRIPRCFSRLCDDGSALMRPVNTRADQASSAHLILSTLFHPSKKRSCVRYPRWSVQRNLDRRSCSFLAKKTTASPSNCFNDSVFLVSYSLYIFRDIFSLTFSPLVSTPSSSFSLSHFFYLYLNVFYFSHRMLG